jgi:hypothetical protein
MNDDGNDHAPSTALSLDDSSDRGKEDVEVAMTDGRIGGDDEREEGGDAVAQDLEYIRNRDILAERLRGRRRRYVIGGVVFALLVASLLAIVLGIASSKRKSERNRANGIEDIFGDDDYGGQQQQQMQQQQQQQQQQHESLVRINDDDVTRPLSSSMEEINIPVLDNDSYIQIGGGPLASLVITNITSQPILGGECLISLDMTEVVYIPPRTTADGGNDIEPYDGAHYECCYEACMVTGGNDGSRMSSSECGVACVTIGIVDYEVGSIGGDDGARRR